jgi:hypothetical protein
MMVGEGTLARFMAYGLKLRRIKKLPCFDFRIVFVSAYKVLSAAPLMLKEIRNLLFELLTIHWKFVWGD